MSRSDWFKYYKIVGLAAAAFIVILGLYLIGHFTGRVSGYYSGKADYAADQYPSETKRNIDNCFDLPSRPEISQCVTEAINTSRENQRSEQDLSAQRDMSESAWWSLSLGVLQFFATIITLGFVKLTLDATLKAVEDTGNATKAMVRQNELTEAAQRPYVIIEAGQSPTAPDERGFIMPASYRYSNVGGTPAQLLWGAHNIVVLDEHNILPEPLIPGLRGRKYANGEVVAANSSTAFKPAGPILNLGSIHQNAPIGMPKPFQNAYKSPTFFHGFVIYADFEGKAYIRGFCFTYSSGEFVLLHPSHAHNYDRRCNEDGSDYNG